MHLDISIGLHIFSALVIFQYWSNLNRLDNSQHEKIHNKVQTEITKDTTKDNIEEVNYLIEIFHHVAFCLKNPEH